AFDALTASKYLSADTYLRRGDVLVKPGSHTVIVLSDGSAAVEKYGKAITVSLHQLSKGNKGEEVRALQILLTGRGYDVGKAGADGEFGADTKTAVEAYQRDHGLSVDGIAGKDTITALLQKEGLA
ncbi:MAG: peptidoglycan-binding protein, partial [Clostridia bacterium]|nr:peptidoglycan-binding protein [Clostridia bacterium]